MQLFQLVIIIIEIRKHIDAKIILIKCHFKKKNIQIYSIFISSLKELWHSQTSCPSIHTIFSYAPSATFILSMMARA